MQSKGLIRTILIVFLVYCAWELLPTFLIGGQNNKAEKYAKEQVAEDPTLDLASMKTAYLDSVGNEKVVNLGITSFTYNELKEQQLKLGLDLQGGMSTVLQVSLVDLIRDLAGNSTDATFDAAVKQAIKDQSNNQADFVTLFGQAFERIDPNARLSAIFATQDLREDISFNSTNAEVLEVLRAKSGEAIKSTYNIIRTRIDQFGVASPNVQLQEDVGRIIVELPGVDNPDRVRELLQATANLEFWECGENSGANGLINFMDRANDAVKRALDAKDPSRISRLKELEAQIAAEDSASLGDASLSDLEDDLDTDSNLDELINEQRRISVPLFSVLTPNVNTLENGSQQVGGGPVVGISYKKDTARVNEYIKMPEFQAVFPKNIKFAWSAIPTENNILQLYALKGKLGNPEPRLEGDVITDARQDTDGTTGEVTVSMQMNRQGAKDWLKITRENKGKPVAIVLDNKVYSAPNIINEISGGNSQITGNFSIREAKDLANILKAGSLPAPAKIIEEAVVGPSLGADNIRSSLIALLVGLILVLIFMLLWYNNGGIAANIALLLNLFFIVGILAAFGGVLTLPGMAGIVLTVGMAVDANVLIFERIREELSNGNGIKQAIRQGYKKSYSAIIDANLTTLITGIILAIFGLGPVLGFAVILIIGIISSMFTAILVTRLYFEWRLDKGAEPKFFTGMSKGVLKNVNIDFIGKRKIAYIIAGVLVGLGLLSILTRGFDLGVDFQGGRNYVIQFDQTPDVEEIRSSLTSAYGETPVVKSFSTDNSLKITTAYKINETGEEVEREIEGLLYAGLKDQFASPPTEDVFKKTHKLSSQKVGPTIADDITNASFLATIIALLMIFGYILLRFRKWQYGLGAVIALFVNVMIVMGIFSIFPGILPFTMEIDQAFIAAILTVIGYSINDTVVVFDRIREYLATYTKKPMKEVINDAINSTLSRTVITSLTTLIVVLILFIFGGEVIRGFAFALLIGIIVGTLSSIFIATPIVTDLTKPERQRVVFNERANRGKNKTKKKATA